MSYKVWGQCNIYDTAKIGDGCNIGWFCEIGDEVEIGENSRIGTFAFIPHGVKIGKNCFIGPRFSATNDKYPPSPKEYWTKIVIEDFVSIGAAVTIVGPVTIGKGARVGAGSVVTKNIPAGEMWYGVPAKRRE